MDQPSLTAVTSSLLTEVKLDSQERTAQFIAAVEPQHLTVDGRGPPALCREGANSQIRQPPSSL